jgi:arylsulfatase A-like enzyme
MISKLQLYILSILLLWMSNCEQKQQQTEENNKAERPNFVIFFTDEMSPDYLSCYGGDMPTPHIDRLAASGTRFENAYTAASMCTPSRFSLMTGQYPGRSKHEDFLDNYPTNVPYSVAWNLHLTPETATIAKSLNEIGYSTGMAGKWHISSLPEGFSRPTFSANDSIDQPDVQQKLQAYQDVVKEIVKKDGGFQEANSVLFGNFDGFPHPLLKFHNIPWITKGAVDFLRKQEDKNDPFMLYVATTAVHGPNHHDALYKDVTRTLEGLVPEVENYQPNVDSLIKAIETKSNPMKHKLAGMAYLDHHVNTIMNTLRQIGKAENTIVMFMSDHNVEPGKATCYEKGTHIPMIIAGPGVSSGVSQSLASTVDVYPTILSLAQGSAPENHVMDGLNMMQVLVDPKATYRDFAYTEAGYARSINDGRMKYIAFYYPQHMVDSMKSGAIDFAPNQLGSKKQAHSSIAIESYPHYFEADQLYNLEEDPYEVNNLAGLEEYAPVLESMQEALREEFMNSFEHPYPAGPAAFRKSAAYEQLVQETKAVGTDYIPWYKPHHGKLEWPPKSE